MWEMNRREDTGELGEKKEIDLVRSQRQRETKTAKKGREREEK